MTISGLPPRSLIPYSIQLVYSEPGIVSEHVLRNVLIMVWDVQPTAAVITRMELAGDDVRQRATRGMSMIHVVRGPLQLPNDEERNAMLRMVRSHNVGVVAMVVTETGFVLSMVRSVVTGLRVLSGGRFDYRICRSFEEAVSWLPEKHRNHTGVDLEKHQLLRALLEVSEAS